MKVSDLGKEDTIKSVEIPCPGKWTMNLILEEIKNSKILNVEIANEVHEITDETLIPVDFVSTGVRIITLKLISK